MRSRIDPLKKFVCTVRNHGELLLNYFRARKAYSSGIVDGLNNKAKVTMRKAYGFRTFKMTEEKLLYLLSQNSPAVFTDEPMFLMSSSSVLLRPDIRSCTDFQ